MRHIPEDELHSYLDQALSRSQCVEIESHLAACAGCRGARDGIAALRDRTTALLATLAPERSRIPPSWESLSTVARERRARSRDRRQALIWAASIMAALGLGWGAQALTHRSPAAHDIAQSAAPEAPGLPAGTARPVRHEDPASVPAARTTTAPAPLAVSPQASHAADREARTPARPAATKTPGEPVGASFSSGRLPQSDFDLVGDGVWRTLSWDNARRERGESVPRIQGLPVVEVQVAAARDSNGKPTMIVAQQLRSGEMIRTIEGPATDVARLLVGPRADSHSPWPTMPDSTALTGEDGTLALRRGDRILAIQASPSVSADSLRAMIRRLNAADR